MPQPHPKAAALASLRQALGTKVRSGSEWLQECEHVETGVSPPLSAGVGVEELVAGLRPGRLTEVLVTGPSRGGGLVLAALLARARREARYAVLFDVGSGLAMESFPGRDLESLLWVGCDSVGQAVAAFDVAVRDENFRWFILDGRDVRPEDWRTVRPAVWQRIAQPLRERGAIGLILSRVPVTGVAKQRYELEARLDLECLHEERSRLLASVRVRSARGASGQHGESQLVG